MMTTKQWLQAAYSKVGYLSWKPSNRTEVDKLVKQGYLKNTGHGGVALTEKAIQLCST